MHQVSVTSGSPFCPSPMVAADCCVYSTHEGGRQGDRLSDVTNLQVKALKSKVEFPSVPVWSVWGWKVSHSLR